MVELTAEQVRAMNFEYPPVAIDPRTREEYVLVRRSTYDQMQGMNRLHRKWERLEDEEFARTSR